MATTEKPDRAPVTLSAAASPAPPTEAELEVLRQVGDRWGAALGGGRGDRGRLPVDPDLPHHTEPLHPLSRYERLAEPDFVTRKRGQLEATRAAARPPGPLGRMLYRSRRVLLGPPLATSSLLQERLSKPVALAVLSSDALSSVAYGTEAMLAVLIVAGSAALWHALPIGAVIVLLMVAVALSYRQTIKAYPRGGGSYIVASDNLGPLPGLTAAAGLMMDYILTVAVSVSAGVAAVTSALPELSGATLEMALVAVGLILVLNLRGVRQAGSAFAVPTYVFVVAILALVAYGLVHEAVNGFPVTDPPPVPAIEPLTAFVILRAFASGSSAMTGIEAISDGVPSFRPPEWRNARTTLTWMVALLATMFAGITLLSYTHGLIPRKDNTILSQLTESEWGRGVLYGVVQVSTALILLLAANTAFNDFPRLLFFLGRDRYAPRLFTRLGDRLAYSNGILVLAVAAAVLVVAFDAETDRLIALYAIGVFLSFTLSQTGMVVRWWRRREPGWKRSLAINAFGGLLSFGVLVVVAITKFTEGAWVVVALIPAVVFLFTRIHRHYRLAGEAIALTPVPEGEGRVALPPPAPEPPSSVPSERAESPAELTQLTVVPMASMDRASLRALAYAVAQGHPTLALHVAPDDESAERMRALWTTWGDHVPLQLVVSPYRSLVTAILNYLAAVHTERPELTLTVVLPELITAHWWQRVLHNQVGRRLRSALRPVRGVVLVAVPFHLPRRPPPRPGAR